jgi:bacillithiol biosynthesis cysteine-adding enzyme BshC
MQKSKINRLYTNYFSLLANKLTYEQKEFKGFIQEEFSIESFKNQLKIKSNFDKKKREILHQSLLEDYTKIDLNSKTKAIIDSLLSENTFTVTTGHQLNIFTGPIYFIYKILDTIKLAEELKKTYPENNFVPIYWMASEDHDFEEINHTYIFNKKISWESNFGGAVGAYPLENFSNITDEVARLFLNYPDAKIHDLLKKYHGENLAQATFSFVNELFQAYGLLIIDSNKANLKKEFIPILKKELESSFSEKEVLKTNEKLAELGFKSQIFPRPINLFYLTKINRIRIVKSANSFDIEGIGSFTEGEILKMVELNPENFSPNVVLRPVYQETILPNLAYIGGAAEISYWTQLKGVFDAVNLTFPLLKIRNSIQIFDQNAQKKIQKLGLDEFQIFDKLEELKKRYIQKNLKNEIDFTDLTKSQNELAQIIEKQILNFDKALLKFAEAEKIKLQNQIETIKQKLIKQQKNQFDSALKQLEDLKNKLFPNNVLQERYDNFLNFCPDGDYAKLIFELYEAIEPCENDLIVLKS